MFKHTKMAISFFLLFMISINIYGSLIPEKDLNELISRADTALNVIAVLNMRLKKIIEDRKIIFLNYGKQNKQFPTLLNPVQTMPFVASITSEGLHATASLESGQFTSPVSKPTLIHFEITLMQSLQSLENELNIFFTEHVKPLYDFIEQLLKCYGTDDNSHTYKLFHMFEDITGSKESYSQICSSACSDFVSQESLSAQVSGYLSYLYLVKKNVFLAKQLHESLRQ